MTQSFSLGGDSMPTAKFEKAGDSITGTVIELSERQSTKLGTNGQLDFWDDGKPKMYYRLVLQTALKEEANDDGRRAVALTGSRKSTEQSSLSAMLDAIAAAGGTNEVAVGAKVTLTMTGSVAPKTVGYNPRKTFAATYVLPSATLGGPVATPPAQQATTVAAPPAPAAAPQFSAEQIEAMKQAGVDVSAFVTV